jgi:hypothetical protein
MPFFLAVVTLPSFGVAFGLPACLAAAALARLGPTAGGLMALLSTTSVTGALELLSKNGQGLLRLDTFSFELNLRFQNEWICFLYASIIDAHMLLVRFNHRCAGLQAFKHRDNLTVFLWKVSEDVRLELPFARLLATIIN